jgi:hypothetical protein
MVRRTDRAFKHSLFEYLFNLSDLLLDLAGKFLCLAITGELGVIRDLSVFSFTLPFNS